MGDTTGTEAGTAAGTEAEPESGPATGAGPDPGPEAAAPAGHAAPAHPPAAPGVPPSLEVEGLAFAYPDGHQALFGVDMCVGRGERVALLGPNGAGKTTLVLHLNGILSAATGTGRGTVRVAGLEVAKPNLREIRRRVGIVFQDPDDQLFMPSVREDVAFGPANLGLRGAELDERVAEALGRVGMERYADRPPHHLSFGQRRRVAVATVLAMRPEILVLDEPSSNLDPASRRELAEILDGLDVTVLMVTHDLPYALELCPRALVLSGGVIAADGPTRELLADRDLMDAHRLELPYGYARPDCPHCAPRDARGGPWRPPAPGPTCGVEHG
ncbi:energy-coupling factor ABC transporter ATP-binding protein [Yinghuangia sp. YIM S09857]|uniref:energy-coupling factor ABC transporter ATP-binding protein n=1 Tax=Yinghuangia sp. YIM S09857 TaxID=3436929 RepID=UPI003F53887D